MTRRQTHCICGKKDAHPFPDWPLVTWYVGDGAYASMYFCSWRCLAEWARTKAATPE